MWLINDILSLLLWPLIYAAIPVYVVGLVTTIGFRDFCELFDFREFSKNIFRKLF